MKGKNKDIIKASFTKYVETAVKRSKKDYIKKGQRREDISADTVIWDTIGAAEMDTAVYDLETANEISWKAEKIRHYLKTCVDSVMWKCLCSLTDFEIQVVFAKVFRQLTFEEIGRKMEEQPGKIASVYSYARKKIKRGWKTNGD